MKSPSCGAFALDCHDREVIGWVATTAGISGEMIRDLMVDCVETRFHDPRAPHQVQWLADNGPVYAAGKTLAIAVALNLEPSFTPVESPESNGFAEADEYCARFSKVPVRSFNSLPHSRQRNLR